jgi:hypothetical protein
VLVDCAGAGADFAGAVVFGFGGVVCPTAIIELKSKTAALMEIFTLIGSPNSAPMKNAFTLGCNYCSGVYVSRASERNPSINTDEAHLESPFAQACCNIIGLHPLTTTGTDGRTRDPI